jgi:hypothetical protein
VELTNRTVQAAVCMTAAGPVPGGALPRLGGGPTPAAGADAAQSAVIASPGPTAHGALALVATMRAQSSRMQREGFA